MSDALGFNNGLNDRWRAAVDAHKAHAKSEWPLEAVGLIDQLGAYHPCENVEPGTAEKPTFGVRDDDLRSVAGGYPVAVLHSHTGLENERGATQPPKDSPSAADMQGQIDSAVPWGISMCVRDGATDPFWFGDQVERPPLYGRSFRHGVNDCYSFIRDWHKQEAGISIPEFPRDADWWTETPELNLYLDGFEKAGFKRVPRDFMPLPGDVFLCSVHANVINHGGVYIGSGLIGHHLTHQLSMRSPATVWRPKLGFLVRHESLPDDWRTD